MIFQKIIIKKYILLIIILLLSGCESWILGDSEVLEYKYAGNLKVVERKEGIITFYEISGHYLGSALNVEKVISFQEGDSLIIEVLLTLRRTEGSSGNFHEDIMTMQPIKIYILVNNERLFGLIHRL